MNRFQITCPWQISSIGPASWLLTLAALSLAAGCQQSPPVTVSHAPTVSAADEEFEKSTDRPPTPKTLYAMAQILEIQGRDSDAQPILTKIIREYPNYLPAYNDLAELHMRRRQIDAAVQTLQDALRIAPDDALMINNLGMCNLIEGEFPAAAKSFTRAAAISPNDTRFRANLAVALGMMGRYEESLSLYRQILPASSAHYNVGILCQSRRDWARADQEFRISQELTVRDKMEKSPAAPKASFSTSPPTGPNPEGASAPPQ